MSKKDWVIIVLVATVIGASIGLLGGIITNFILR